jgi:ribulose-phosphate 3-epimerase
MAWTERAREVEVEPSIYAADFSRLREQLAELVEAGVYAFHFDTGDGHFVPEITIGPVVLEAISPFVRGWGCALDCHLMVSEPRRHLESFARAGADSVTFHVEAVEDVATTIAEARALELGVGVAFNPETSVETAAEAGQEADLVNCMSIHPGYSGQKLMPEALGRIEQLRSLLPDRVRVQVDGGVNDDTIEGVRRAGADLIVAGSAVFWHDDPAERYGRLAELVGVPVAG